MDPGDHCELDRRPGLLPGRPLDHGPVRLDNVLIKLYDTGVPTDRSDCV